MNFDEKAYSDSQQNYDNYFGSLLDKIEQMEKDYNKTNEMYDLFTKQAQLIEANQQILKKYEILKEGTVQLLQEKMDQIQQDQQLELIINEFKQQFTFSNEELRQLESPFDKLSDIVFEKINIVINHQYFAQLYKKCKEKIILEDPIYLLLSKIENLQIIISKQYNQILEMPIEKRDLTQLQKHQKIFILLNSINSKTGGQHALQIKKKYIQIWNERIEKFAPVLQSVDKFQYNYCYPVTVTSKDQLVELNVFMPIIGNSKKYVCESEVLQQFAISELNKLTAQQLGEEPIRVYTNSFMFFHQFNNRFQFPQLKLTELKQMDQLKPKLQLSQFLKSGVVRVSLAGFQQSVYPEHLLNQLFQDIRNSTSCAEFSQLFGSSTELDFADLMKLVTQAVTALVNQLDFCGCVNYIKQGARLESEAGSEPLLKIIKQSQLQCQLRLLYMYKQLYGSAFSDPKVQKHVESLTQQSVCIETDDKQTTIVCAEEQVLKMLTELITTSNQQKLMPKCNAFAFRMGYFLLALKSLQKTPLSFLYSVTIKSFTDFITQKSQVIFKDQADVPQYCYSFIINTFGIVNKILGNIIELDVYYQELSEVGRGLLLEFLRKEV